MFKKSNTFSLICDGHKIGFCAIGNDGERIKYGKRNLFPNISSLKSILIAEEIPQTDYSIHLFINADEHVEEIPLSSLVSINNCMWGYFSDEKNFLIRETHVHAVTTIGYFTYAGSNAKTKGREAIYKKQEEIFDALKDAASSRDFCSKNNVVVSKDIFGEFVLKSTKNTMQLHIMTNNSLISLNVIRKEAYLKCFPFDKSMDKYGTIYVYTTMDKVESKNGKDYCLEQILALEKEARELYPDMDIRFSNMDFDGYINITEEEVMIDD